MESALLPLVKGGTGVEISTNASFLKGLRGPLPTLRGIARADKQLAVVFLPVSMFETPQTGQLGVMAAVQVVSSLAQDRLPPEVNDSRYPVALGDAADPFALRTEALDLLYRMAREEAVPPAPAIPLPGQASTNSPAVVRETQSDSDRSPAPPVQERKPAREDESW